jgi:hypothetical protein
MKFLSLACCLLVLTAFTSVPAPAPKTIPRAGFSHPSFAAASAAAPKAKSKTISALPPLPPAVVVKSILAKRSVTILTNDGVVMVYIGTNGVNIPKLLGSPMFPKAAFKNALTVVPGPMWTQASYVEYFPPDPQAGKYFIAYATAIPPGTVTVEGTIFNNQWLPIFSSTWSDPTATLGFTVDAGLNVQGFRLKSIK